MTETTGGTLRGGPRRLWLIIGMVLLLPGTAAACLISGKSQSDDSGVAIFAPLVATRVEPPGLGEGFDRSEPGRLPDGFVLTRTGPGEDGRWVVQADASAPSAGMVLAQTSTDATNDRYPLFVSMTETYRDVDVTVRFKAVSGRIDQAGGIVFRYRDPDNYYVVRANALEDNIRLYTVIDGRRTQLAGADLTVSAQTWHTLRVVCLGDRIDVYFDDQRVIGARNTAISDAGYVGVWTKADSVTLFDDLRAWTVR